MTCCLRTITAYTNHDNKVNAGSDNIVAPVHSVPSHYQADRYSHVYGTTRVQGNFVRVKYPLGREIRQTKGKYSNI